MEPDTDTPTVSSARREQPTDHPNEHIDVSLDLPTGGRSILRFDLTPDPEIARYRYELSYDGVMIDTDQELIDIAARHIYEECGIDAQVSRPIEEGPDGLVEGVHIADCDRV